MAVTFIAVAAGIYFLWIAGYEAYRAWLIRRLTELRMLLDRQQLGRLSEAEQRRLVELKPLADRLR